MSDDSLLIRPLLFFLLLDVAVLTAGAQTRIPFTPKMEVRAVWLTTASGLDWPRSVDVAEQQSSLRDIVFTLRHANFNTIFFQARARGDAYYRSAYEPWAENLTGVPGRDPGWDPLAFLIREAHAVGIEVHAWLSVFKIRGSGGSGTSPHPSRVHPEWTVNYDGEGWFDPGIPEVRSYLIALILDLAGHYDIDGVNFDYARYPGSDFNDGETYRRYGGGTNKAQWRKANIDRFVKECYERLTAARPMIKVGASPLGMGGSEIDPSSGFQRRYSQDAREWLKSGKLDYIAPQLYWDIGESRGDPDFVGALRRWQQNSSGRHVYAGIAAYKPEVAREITAQIDSVRMLGAAGESFFRYENIKGLTQLSSRYETAAAIPPMPWKDGIPPATPPHVAVNELATNIFQLEWLPAPAASDGDRAHHYMIYRWPSRRIPYNDPRALAFISPGSETAYVDTVRTPSGPTFFYAVSAVDKANNEGTPSPVSSGTASAFLALRGILSDVTALSASISPKGGAPQFVAYSLAHRVNVDLSVVAHVQAAPERLVVTLAHGIQEGGTYVVGLHAMQLDPGRYVVRLKAGDTVVEQPIDVTQ